jgi:hypothetical protein
MSGVVQNNWLTGKLIPYMELISYFIEGRNIFQIVVNNQLDFLTFLINEVVGFNEGWE